MLELQNSPQCKTKGCQKWKAQLGGNLLSHIAYFRNFRCKIKENMINLDQI